MLNSIIGTVCGIGGYEIPIVSAFCNRESSFNGVKLNIVAVNIDSIRSIKYEFYIISSGSKLGSVKLESDVCAVIGIVCFEVCAVIGNNTCCDIIIGSAGCNKCVLVNIRTVLKGLDGLVEQSFITFGKRSAFKEFVKDLSACNLGCSHGSCVSYKAV